ncbi:MAG: hypothetical protein P8Y97_20690 [Candidatus Lokiarchaeota archaeon]
MLKSDFNINFGYNSEFNTICREVFKMSFHQKRDSIFKPVVECLAIKYKNDPRIQLKIAIGLNLCKEADSNSQKARAASWVKSYIKRNYGVSVGNLPNLLLYGNV